MSWSKSNVREFSDRELAEREADILGFPQRVQPLKLDELDDEARAAIVQLRESAGQKDHSKIPDIFLLMMKHPRLYRCQVDMAAMLFRGEISERDRELAVLRVAWLCRAPYEWGQHVEIAKRFGISSDEIERITRGADAAEWTQHEAAVLSAVDELLSDQMICDATWNTLSLSWNEQQLIEFPAMVGQYVAVAYSQNALRVRLHAGNRGLRHR